MNYPIENIEQLILCSIYKIKRFLLFTKSKIYFFLLFLLLLVSFSSFAYDGPPVITLHPSVNVICRNNQAAIFNSDATGSPSPTVQWQVSSDNGTNWINLAGGTDKTYTFTPGNTDNGKQFRAVYSNIHGVVYTNAALLSVGSGINFPKDLDGQFACDGLPILSTKITGGVGLSGIMTFFWERSSDGIAWALIFFYFNQVLCLDE